MKPIKTAFTSTLILLVICWLPLSAQKQTNFKVIGYYAGPSNLIDSFETSKLTHLIYCFGHLEGNRFKLNSSEDTLSIKKIVAMKTYHSSLKVMLSLGGWGGCSTCSDVFNTETGRKEFALSVKEISAYFNTDGIDLDWEYPAIKGYPGHAYREEDKLNFTLLLKELRKTCGKKFEISFASGGFTSYIETSIDWKKATKYINFINVMSYDLVHGYSTLSGHHTPLFSTPQQAESTDHAVQLMLEAGVPANQIIIGAAFYGRYFKIEEGNPVDLYQPCYFLHGFSSQYMQDSLSEINGFEKRWDEIAQAPYAIHYTRRLVATYDDERSIALKTRYAIENKLGGIMFWQLVDDKFHDGLLDMIDKNK